MKESLIHILFQTCPKCFLWEGQPLRGEQRPNELKKIHEPKNCLLNYWVFGNETVNFKFKVKIVNLMFDSG